MYKGLERKAQNVAWEAMQDMRKAVMAVGYLQHLARYVKQDRSSLADYCMDMVAAIHDKYENVTVY